MKVAPLPPARLGELAPPASVAKRLEQAKDILSLGWAHKATIEVDNEKLDRCTDLVLSEASVMPTPVGNDMGAKPAKWSGGVVAQRGMIYGIPHNSSHVLQFDMKFKSACCVGDDMGSALGKWSGGILAPDGCVIGIPYSAPQVMHFDPATKRTTTFGEDFGTSGKKWSGGVLAADGCIYCIPFDAGQVLKIDPKALKTELLEEDLGPAGGKWCGGVLGPDGCVYGIPCNSSKFLKISPLDGSATVVGKSLGRSESKWCGGVLGPDGLIYGIPSSSPTIVCFDPVKLSVTRVGDDLGDADAKWEGGVLGTDGCIYAVPCSSAQILSYNIKSRTTSLTESSIATYSQMWSNGVLAPDGFIYGIPFNAGRMLAFDHRKHTMILLEEDFGPAAAKWAGGVSTENGYIYFVPCNAAQVLRLSPKGGSEMMQDTIDMGEGGSKWSGGVLAQDGCVYCVPRDAANVLQIDPKSDSTALVGPNLGAEGGKWQNGVMGTDGSIYFLPRNASQVLKFDPSTHTSSFVSGDLGNRKDKWSAGVLASDGFIYGIPASASQMLRIDPNDPAVGGASAVCFGTDFGEGQGKWSFGAQASDGFIYCIPRNASKVMKFDPATGIGELVGEDLSDAKGKWDGGIVGQDGCIYGVPRNSSAVLRYDPRTSATTLLGNLGDAPGKWSGGAAGAHGCLYCIPSCAAQTLQIYTNVAECAVLQCLGFLVGSDDRRCRECAKTSHSPDCLICGAAARQASVLLARGLSNANHGIFRQIILNQWRLLCSTSLGPQSLAFHLMQAPGCLGQIFNMEAASRDKFLEVFGVCEYMRRPDSVSAWLQDRLLVDPSDAGYADKMVATLQYFSLTSKLTVNDTTVRHELILALAKLPRLLANMLTLPDEETDKFVATPILSCLVDFKAEQPPAVLTQLLDCISISLLIAFFWALTWPNDVDALALPISDFMSRMAIGVLSMAGVVCAYELWQLFAMARLGLLSLYLMQNETWTDFAMIACVSAVAALRLASREASDGDYKIIVVVSTGLLLLRLLTLLMTLNRGISTFVISLGIIMRNLVPFVVVLGSTMFAFCHCFQVVQVGCEEPVEFFSQYGDVWFSVFAMTMGGFDKGWFPASTLWSRALFVAYMLFVFIIMLNVLIAVISDSYGSAQGKAQILFVRTQLQYCAMLDAMHLTYPSPPDSIPSRIAKSFRASLGLLLSVFIDSDIAVEDRDPEMERLQEIEKKFQAYEKSCTLKIETAMEAMLQKTEARLLARLSALGGQS